MSLHSHQGFRDAIRLQESRIARGRLIRYDLAVGENREALESEQDTGSTWSAEPIEVARVMYRNRRARNRHFDDSLFAEPRWDILLDLFVAGEEGRAISVSSACIGAAVPHATALRHLGTLQQKGLVIRSADPRDARCQHVRITDSAAASMCDLFADLG